MGHDRGAPKVPHHFPPGKTLVCFLGGCGISLFLLCLVLTLSCAVDDCVVRFGGGGIQVASRPTGGLRGNVSAPAGYGAAPLSKKYVCN